MKSNYQILLPYSRIKILCSFIFLILINHYAFSQGKEGNVWHFGQRSGVTFNLGSPAVYLPGGKTNLSSDNQGSACISDQNGGLLFYSDGRTVWNRNNEVMLNGEEMGWYCSQGGVILPYPEHDSLYLFFNFGGDSIGMYGWDFQYSVIDMRLDGGLGGVVSNKKRIVISSNNFTDGISAVRATEEDSYWVITHKWNNNVFAVYPINADGIGLFPVTSAIGVDMTDQYGVRLKISPNGKYLAYFWPNNSIYFFDNETGHVYGDDQLIQEGEAIGGEFSPDNTKFYVSDLLGPAPWNFYQYDLTAGTPQQIYDSRVLLADNMALGRASLQLGPDGKIYIGSQHNDHSLHVINRPNQKGLSCDLQMDAIELYGTMPGDGLPTIMQSYLNDPVIVAEQLCLNDSTLFSIKNTHGIDSVYWEFRIPPDILTSTSFTPRIYYPAAGSYSVKLIVYSGNLQKTISKTINIVDPPHPQLGPDITKCTGSNVTLSVPSGYPVYLWNGVPGSYSYQAIKAGRYIIQITDTSGCSGYDTIQFSYYPNPVIDESTLNIAPTTCNASTGAITGISVSGLDPLSYVWKNGGGTILGHDLDLFHLPVDNYTLWVTDAAGCDTPVKMYTIKNVGDSLILSVDHQNAHCNKPDGTIQVNATAGLTNMLFYAIDTSNFLSNQGLFSGLSPGSYQVWVKDSLGCKKVYDGNPVIVLNSPGPSLLPPVIQDEINGQSDGSITIVAINPADSLWYSIGGVAQLNNGQFSGLIAGTYSCSVTDAFGCDTTFTVIIKNIPSIRLEAIAGDGSTCLGNVAVVPLLANNFSHVSAFNSRLKYNKNLVTCQNYLNANSLLTDSIKIDLFPTLGEMAITWTGKNPVNLLDGSTLLELSFASLMTGQDSLKWDISPGICTFLDSIGNLITPQFKQGQVRVYSLPQASIQVPNSVCEGSDLPLIATYIPGSGNGTVSYQWSGPDGFNDSNPVTFISNTSQFNAGEYTLNIADTNHCQNNYSIDVNITPIPIADFKKDTLYFDEQTYLPAKEGYFSYQWSTGDTTSTILVTSEGWYKVTMKTPEGCLATDSVMMLYSFAPFNMPNAFTPNGDLHNDQFRPVTLPEKVKSFTMYIYNRWGQLVYSTNDLSNGWDGMIGGNQAPMGVYTYIISYGNQTGESRKKTGTFTLIR